jgi:hypothetical protein
MNSYGTFICFGGICCLAGLVPLVIFLIARRVRSRSGRALLYSAGAVAVVWVCYVGIVMFSYGWALHLEKRWHPANPKTRAELEHHLSLYSVRQIAPTDSLSGKNHVLNRGERMIQYRIVWDSPLDVVYDDLENIKAIYTSYE